MTFIKMHQREFASCSTSATVMKRRLQQIHRFLSFEQPILLAYEHFPAANASKGPLLLIHGLLSDPLAFPERRLKLPTVATKIISAL
jgi:hypothetical protein